MDVTERVQALRTAKSLISASPLMAHMNKYNRDQLSYDVATETTGFRYEFHLDPQITSWAAANPSIQLSLNYATDPKGSRLDEAGGRVVDNFLYLRFSTSTTEMTLSMFRQREAMMSMVYMLTEMLETLLPPRITITMETSAEVVEKRKRSSEQSESEKMLASLGHSMLKGLRKGGSSRTRRLTQSYVDLNGAYPASGTYRYKHVKAVYRNGHPKEVAYYKLRVIGTDEPIVSVQHVAEL